MKRGSRFPDHQAQIVFADILVEQLEPSTKDERIDVLTEIVRLCDAILVVARTWGNQGGLVTPPCLGLPGRILALLAA